MDFLNGKEGAKTAIDYTQANTKDNIAELHKRKITTTPTGAGSMYYGRKSVKSTNDRNTIEQSQLGRSKKSKSMRRKARTASMAMKPEAKDKEE